MGTRPGRHYRIIKTKKGPIVKFINFEIPRKVKRKETKYRSYSGLFREDTGKPIHFKKERQRPLSKRLLSPYQKSPEIRPGGSAYIPKKQKSKMKMITVERIDPLTGEKERIESMVKRRAKYTGWSKPKLMLDKPKDIKQFDYRLGAPEYKKKKYFPQKIKRQVLRSKTFKLRRR